MDTEEEFVKFLETRPEEKPYKIEGLAQDRMFCLQGDWKTHKRGGKRNTMPDGVREEIMRGSKPTSR